MSIQLVTGGLGLAGRAIVDALLAEGATVRVLDLERHPDDRVESIVGDVRDAATVEKACRGVETAFHTAAIVSQHPAHAARLHDVNVVGTERLLEASRAAGVRRFVFTSSIDVVFSGRPISGGDESLPYADPFLDDYARTKALAEQKVLAANGADFATCALRTAGIYGPHDRNRFPQVLEYARRYGFVALGDGRAKFSHVYVDNVAHAHLLAAKALKPGSPVAGNAYFITDHPASNFCDFVAPYLADLGIKRRRYPVPETVAMAVAHVVEALYAVAGRFIQAPPTLTRYTVAATCRDFWFVHDRATRDFGYQPIVTEEEATRRTRDWLLSIEKRPALNGAAKAA